MRTLFTRPLAAVGTLALAATALLATATPAHAAADTTLTVTVVDQYGNPAPGVLNAYDSSGNQYDDGSSSLVSTHAITLPSGAGYSFYSVTGWSGLQCFGIASCPVSGSPSGFTPVMTVPVNTPTAYTLTVTAPSITGGTAVGSPLTVVIPPGLQTLNAALAAAGPPYGGLSTANPTQWLRGGADIPGATSSSTSSGGPGYTTVRDDGGQPVAARLSPSPGQTAIFGNAGYTVPPLTTNSIAVVKAVPQKTKTKVSVSKNFRVGEKVTMSVKVKSKGTGTPDGKVTVSIGKFKTSKKLDEDGEALINLPRLAPGTYKVLVKYNGSEDFAKSKAKKVTVTVRK